MEDNTVLILIFLVPVVMLWSFSWGPEQRRRGLNGSGLLRWRLLEKVGL